MGMNEIYQAKPRDIYVDENGKLWRVVATWSEPTVILREIEPQPLYQPQELHGGIGGYMWIGFKRIYRPEEKKNGN